MEFNLLSAIDRRSLPEVIYLLQSGADPNLPMTNVGLGPVHYAVIYHCPDILEVLISSGANINDCNNDCVSVLQLAVQIYPTNPELAHRFLEILLQSGRITDPDILGQSLQYTCGMGYSSLVHLLLQAGSDPNYFPKEDEFEMTPLIGMIFENAAEEAHVTIVQDLLSYGADVNHSSAGMTALQYAEKYGRIDLIPLLSQLQGK